MILPPGTVIPGDPRGILRRDQTIASQRAGLLPDRPIKTGLISRLLRAYTRASILDPRRSKW